jgi:hypothetical protein
MNLRLAVEYLSYHNKWRLGAKIDQLHPKQVTQAIDVVLEYIAEDRYTKQEFLNAAKLGEVSMIDAKHLVSLLDEVREKNNL